MTLTKRSTLEEVAVLVTNALSQSGIRAVLTGGACASLHSKGAIRSYDLDFVLQSAVTRKDLDAAMLSIGFRRQGRLYRNPSTKFFVDFPPGPLGIGKDIGIRPITYRVGSAAIRMLSATDSCRDRLAAFYHWSDRQSLLDAVEIARIRSVNLRKIREWSTQEGALDAFKRFTELLRAKRLP